MKTQIKIDNGFTLIELMITVAVIGILAAIAYPSYVEYVHASRRTEAIAALEEIQQIQERWRSNHPEYANSSEIGAALTHGLTTPSGYYALSISASSATGYTATATAQGKQAADSTCTSLSVSIQQGDISYDATPSANTDRCWKNESHKK